MQTAVFFDLDGVLVDTEPQYAEFWSAIGQKYVPQVADFAAQIKGCTLVQIYNAYFADDTAAQLAITEALNAFESRMQFPWIKGARTWVDALRAAGIPTAVVTSSNRAKMAALKVAHPDFDDLFDRVLTAEDAKRSKPAPDCYLEAAKRMGLPIGQCYVFEDSLNGLRAAHSSGARVIGLTTTLPKAEMDGLALHTMPDFDGFDVATMLRIGAE